MHGLVRTGVLVVPNMSRPILGTKGSLALDRNDELGSEQKETVSVKETPWEGIRSF